MTDAKNTAINALNVLVAFCEYLKDVILRKPYTALILLCFQSSSPV